MADALHRKYPALNLVLTLGSKGAIYYGADGSRYEVGIYQNPVVDTTAAGDTFTGYFLSQVTRSGNAELALKQASIASGISVSRKGASPSVPAYAEVQAVDEGVLRPFNG